MTLPKPVIDHTVINALRGLFDDDVRASEFLGELVKVFCEAGAETLAELDGKLRAADVRGIEAKAHKLKGLSRNIGAVRLGDLCAELEAGARVDAAPPAAVDHCQNLEHLFRASCAELDRTCRVAG